MIILKIMEKDCEKIIKKIKQTNKYNEQLKVEQSH